MTSDQAPQLVGRHGGDNSAGAYDPAMPGVVPPEVTLRELVRVAQAPRGIAPPAGSGPPFWVPAMVATLRRGGRDFADPAGEMLDDLRGAALPLAVALADEAQPHLRRLAARIAGYGRLGRDRAVNQLPRLLADPDDTVRHEAVSAVACLRVGDRRHFAENLLALLGDANAEVRAEAAWALARDAGPEPQWAVAAVAALRSHLAASDDIRVPWYTAEIIAKIGAPAVRAEPETVPALVAALDHPADIVRDNAADALGELGAAAVEALPALRDALTGRGPRRPKVAPNLARIVIASPQEHQATLQWIASHLAGDDADAAMAVMLVARSLGGVALALLADLTAVQNNPQVSSPRRIAAAAAIVAIAGPATPPATRAILMASLHHTNSTVRGLARKAFEDFANQTAQTNR